MSMPANIDDTLYDDPCDQMGDYEEVLAESGGIQMAIALLKTEPEESGQSPHGIWGLFGIEAILSASGSPSRSDSCGFLREWGKSMNFCPTPALIVEMKSCLDRIFKCRKTATEFPEALPEDADEILATMIRRIESLPLSDEVEPASDPSLANPMTESDVDPQAEIESLPIPPISASSHRAPSWWPALLEFTAKAFRESTDNDSKEARIAQLARIVAANPMNEDLRFLSYISFTWSPLSRSKESRSWEYEQERIQAEFEKTGKWPLDRKSLVHWLTERLDDTDSKDATPLECLLNPSILANSPDSRSYPDYVKGEAYGALIDTVSQRSPKGLKKLIPGLNLQHAQFFDASGPRAFRTTGESIVRVLFEEWTGIRRDGSTGPLPEELSLPVDFWNEIKDLFIGLATFPGQFIDSLYGFCFLFQALWSAWTAGDCTSEIYGKIYTLERYKLFKASFNQIRERGEGDTRIIEFTKQHVRNLTVIIRKLIEECILNDDWNNLNSLTYDYTEKRGIEFLSIAAHKLLSGASIEDVEELARVEVLNPGDDLEALREQLLALPQKTLKQLLPHTRLALPIVLDLIEDRKFTDTFRVILGTFSEPLMPDTSDDFAKVCKNTQVYHPGRAACGTTDFNPFYDAIAKCPKTVMDEIFKIVGNSIFSIVEGGSTRLKLYTGLPVREKDADGDRPAIRAISRRLPANLSEREQELNRRILDLAAYVQKGDRPKLDFIFRWLLHQLRDAAYLWAEATGQSSWTEAAFDMARRSRCDEPLEFEGYTLKQSPQVHPGYTVAKKGKFLKSVPPAIAKATEVISFTHLAHFHRLMAMQLRAKFFSDQLRTGEEPDVEFCNHHLSVFQIDPRDWLRERAVLILPDASREVLRERIDHKYRNPIRSGHDPKVLAILPDFRFSPAELFPRLLESHWMWEFDSRSESYHIRPHFGCPVGFNFSIHLRWGVQKSGRLPTEMFRLNLKHVGFNAEISQDDPIWDRLIDRVLQDLVLASSVV